jgi:predicted GTPase
MTTAKGPGEARRRIVISARRIVIAGAAGRDFHNFNVLYRGDGAAHVVAFTAAQIPGIANRRYPPELAGSQYPGGIPIVDESELEALIRRERVDTVIFSYSDVRHEDVMHLASRALAAGADFLLVAPAHTQLAAARPVIAIDAVRTGAGKSQTTRHIAELARARGLRLAVVRHPMPYGDLAAEAVQRFASEADLKAGRVTVEEREEYEPHIAMGGVVFAGVDYAAILKKAEAEADLILWDGGNNDASFFRPDVHVVVADALRPGDELRYHPGETVLRMADIVVINKADAAPARDVATVEANARAVAPGAAIVRAASPVTLDDAAAVKGRRVLVIEDGPTITHGGVATGAGFRAAEDAGAGEIIDPRSCAAGSLADVYRRHPHIGRVLPAMGYSDAQLGDVRQTILNAGVDAVVAGTPIDLGRLLDVPTPVVRARYAYADAGAPTLEDCLAPFLGGVRRRAPS